MNSLIAFCDEAVAIASDSSVSFFSPKTLRKFRVESFTDFRLVGLYFALESSGPVLHLVDTVGNYVAVDIRTMLSVRSLKLPLTVEEGAKKTVAARPKTLPGTSTLSRAFFYESDDGEGAATLRVVIVSENSFLDIQPSNPTGTVRKRGEVSHRHLDECIVAVGERNGAIAFAQRGQRWVSYIESATSRTINIQLSINVESVACHPTSRGVSVGGQRGELHIFQDATDHHHFEDHWHHTSLKSLRYSADGSSLFTGAHEGILLIWNLHSFTFKKLGVHMGTITNVATTSSNTAGTSFVLLSCGDSVLATVDLLQQRVARTVDGISWSSSSDCSGIIHTRWMGQSAVVLKGQQNIVRICDPQTQQTLHTIRVSTQMETVSNPPTCGIKQVGLFDDGRSVATVEVYTGASLPSVLRFWRYDAATKTHMEVQSVYHPHTSDIISLAVDETKRRVFTMSKTTIKAWVETVSTANDATRGNEATSTRWVCVSTMATPSTDVSSMTITDDGSVLLVADDSVYAFDVSSVQLGVRWNMLVRFTQNETTESLHNLTVNIPQKFVYAHSSMCAFQWSLSESSGPRVFRSVSLIRSTVVGDDGSMTLATDDGKLIKLNPQTMSEAISTVYDATAKGTIDYFVLVDHSHLGVIDSARGFRIISLPGSTASSNSSSNVLSNVPDRSPQPALQSFFRSTAEDVLSSADESLTGLSAKLGQVWLSDVLGSAPYTAPLPSSMLKAYIQTVNEPFAERKW